MDAIRALAGGNVCSVDGTSASKNPLNKLVSKLVGCDNEIAKVVIANMKPSIKSEIEKSLEAGMKGEQILSNKFKKSIFDSIKLVEEEYDDVYEDGDRDLYKSNSDSKDIQELSKYAYKELKSLNEHNFNENKIMKNIVLLSKFKDKGIQQVLSSYRYKAIYISMTLNKVEFALKLFNGDREDFLGILSGIDYDLISDYEFGILLKISDDIKIKPYYLYTSVSWYDMEKYKRADLIQMLDEHLEILRSREKFKKYKEYKQYINESMEAITPKNRRKRSKNIAKL